MLGAWALFIIKKIRKRGWNQRRLEKAGKKSKNNFEEPFIQVNC